MKQVPVQNVTVIGPNLPRVDSLKATFHVHAQGCLDGVRLMRRAGGDSLGWTVPATSRESVAALVYGDMIDEGSMSVQDALDDIWFAPCVLVAQKDA